MPHSNTDTYPLKNASVSFDSLEKANPTEDVSSSTKPGIREKEKVTLGETEYKSVINSLLEEAEKIVSRGKGKKASKKAIAAAEASKLLVVAFLMVFFSCSWL